MATKTYIIEVWLNEGNAGESDETGEYYGSFYYQYEGQSDWTLLAQTNDSNTWNILDAKADGYIENNFGGPPGFIGGSHSTRVASTEIQLPTSAKFVKVQASIKEYDPTAFDADENLGSHTISVPITDTRSQERTTQGSSSSGTVGWTVGLTPKNSQLSQSRWIP